MFQNKLVCSCWLTICFFYFGPPLATAFQGEVGGESKTHREPYSPSGGLILVGGGEVSAEIRQRFFDLAGGPQAKIVVIPTASASADENEFDYWLEPWQKLVPLSVKIAHTRERAVADTAEFCADLEDATGIWISGGDQANLAEAYLSTRAARAIESLPQRGGVVGGTSAGAAIASRIMIAKGNDTPKMATGFDLLPGAIVDQHFSQRQRSGRLIKAVAKHPDCLGIGIDEDTAVVFQGRSMEVLGPGKVHLRFAATAHYPITKMELKPGQRNDWETLLRACRERFVAPFPVPNLAPQIVFPKSGSLVIVGGGGLPKDILQRFVELAGGSKARIVVLPTALENVAGESGEGEMFRQAGAGFVVVLPQTTPAELASEEYLDQIRAATGIWFGGGRQWRFVDHYAETPALAEFRQCLQRGGVIGGSSAGATIQGELLIRGAPIGNEIMVQDGYRRGFGFLSGVGIDQHFTQRNRFADLRGTIQRFPSMIGLGIDEATALVVTSKQAEVMGSGKLHVLVAKNEIDSIVPADDGQDSAKANSAATLGEVGAPRNHGSDSNSAVMPNDIFHHEYGTGSILTAADFVVR